MLAGLLTKTSLRELAGSRSFQRGEEYFVDGAVERLRASTDKISAVVEGSETYQVDLRVDDGDLDYDCTCPYAAEGNFCKHCVAVGLAWLAGQGKAAKGGRTRKTEKRDDPWRMIRDYLADQPREALLEIVLEVALRDDRLYQTLELQAGRSCGPGYEVKAFRRAITEATRIRGFIDWRQAGSFAGNLDRVVDELAESLKPATAAALIELAEYGIERTENALLEIDDSSGSVGGVVFRLGELHLKACRMARPEADDLAARLFRLETTLPFGLCRFDPLTYRQVLGKAGMARYRELAEAEWRKIKPRGKDDRDFDGHRFAITRLMEKLAEADGDIEQLVEIKSRDLSSGYSYLEIAEIWKKGGQPDKALDWAERGLRAFPERTDNRLRDFLVAVYLKRKRPDEALQLTWVQFAERPALEPFTKLKRVAEKLEIWPEQRQRALAKVEEAIAAQSKKVGRLYGQETLPNYSLLLEIALWEKDLDAAWAVTQRGLCNQYLLLALAGGLEATRPEDAVHLYQRVIPRLVEQTNNEAYKEAVKLIGKVGRLLRAGNMGAQLGRYREELATRFKAKRNFIKFLKELK